MYKNTITREQLRAHMEKYITSGAADNPEYGGDRVDWIWDWLWQQGVGGLAFNEHNRWIVMRSPDAPDNSR